jgi:hypothetical protein
MIGLDISISTISNTNVCTKVSLETSFIDQMGLDIVIITNDPLVLSGQDVHVADRFRYQDLLVM